jgi:hypothetical protein
MPHEWRCNGLSNGSPSSSDRTSGLIADATEAFIDRREIDWTALLERLPRGPARTLVENLRVIDTIRESPTTGGALDSPSPRFGALQVVVASAWLHTIWSVVPAVAASLAGTPVRIRAARLALACAFTAASLILASAVARDRRSLALLAAFAASGTAFAREAIGSGAGYAPPGLSLVMHGVFPEAFVPACLWQFARVFPRVDRFTIFDRVARTATIAAWALGSAMFCVNLALAHGLVAAPSLQGFARGTPDSYFWHLFAIALAPAAAVIFVRSRAARPAERAKVVRFSGAIAAGTAPFLILAVLRTLSPALDAWLVTASGAARHTVDVVVTAGLVATPVLSTIALLVDRPFEHFVPARIGYRVLRLAVHLLILAPCVLMAATVYRVRHASLFSIAGSAAGATVLLCVAVVALLVVLRRRMLEALSVQPGDTKRELTNALAALASARGVRERAAVMTRRIVAATGAREVCVLVVDGTGDAFADALGGASFPDGAIVAMARETAQPLDLSWDAPLAHVLPPAERAWLEARCIELVVPVKRADGSVVAIVACGRKGGGARFDRRDLWFLTTLAAAAGASWEAHRPDRAWRLRRASAEVALECPRCGMVADRAPLACGCDRGLVTAALPRRLARVFLVERRLGSGGMGVVYRARDTRLDRLVALKTLPRLRPGAVDQLRREARAMARLNHESLATIYGLEMWRDTPVLVVEYFPAGTLADLVAVAPLTPVETTRLGIRLARALEYMHERGVVHCDLKPPNVGMTPGRLPVLLDFGLVSLSSPESSPDAATAGPGDGLHGGTRGYLPPEACRGRSATPAFDLWALAVVMLEALTGSRPGPPPAVGLRDRGVAIELSAVRRLSVDLTPFFERALAREAGRRFQTAAEIGAFLRELESR